MKRLGVYRSYLLYEVEEEEGRDINTSSGSRYIRNSVLVFVPEEENPKLGKEWRVCKDKEEAKKEIDDSFSRLPMREQMKRAEEKSRLLEQQREYHRKMEREKEIRRREQEEEEAEFYKRKT